MCAKVIPFSLLRNSPRFPLPADSGKGLDVLSRRDWMIRQLWTLTSKESISKKEREREQNDWCVCKVPLNCKAICKQMLVTAAQSLEPWWGSGTQASLSDEWRNWRRIVLRKERRNMKSMLTLLFLVPWSFNNLSCGLGIWKMVCLDFEGVISMLWWGARRTEEQLLLMSRVKTSRLPLSLSTLPCREWLLCGSAWCFVQMFSYSVHPTKQCSYSVLPCAEIAVPCAWLGMSFYLNLWRRGLIN